MIFALEGVSYEIDLNQVHVDDITEALAAHVAAGRKVSGRKSSARTCGASRPAGARLPSVSSKRGLAETDPGVVAAVTSGCQSVGSVLSVHKSTTFPARPLSCHGVAYARASRRPLVLEHLRLAKPPCRGPGLRGLAQLSGHTTRSGVMRSRSSVPSLSTHAAP